MHFLGGLQGNGVGGLPGPSTLAAGRPAYHLVQVRYGQTLTTLQWSHDTRNLVDQYHRMNFAAGKGQYIIKLGLRPRYNGAMVVYPATHRGWVVMEEAGKYSIQPPGTAPLGAASMPMDDTAVARIGAGPAISPFQPRAGAEVRPATSQTITTPDVRAAEATAWGAATKAEQRDATLMKWGPPVAVVGAVALIAAWWFLGRKKR